MPDWTEDYDDDNPAVVLRRLFEDHPLPKDEESFRRVADYCEEEVEVEVDE